MDHTDNSTGNVIDRKSAKTKSQVEKNNHHHDENDVDDDDDDLSSLGDASPMNEAIERQKARVKLARANMRKFLGVLTAIAYLIFQFSSFNSKSAIHSMQNGDSIYSSSSASSSAANMNMTKLIRQQHISHVATSLSKIYKPTSPNVWCIDGRLKYEQGKRRPMGLCYLKIPRSASTYLAGSKFIIISPASS